MSIEVKVGQTWREKATDALCEIVEVRGLSAHVRQLGWQTVVSFTFNELRANFALYGALICRACGVPTDGHGPGCACPLTRVEAEDAARNAGEWAKAVAVTRGADVLNVPLLPPAPTPTPAPTAPWRAGQRRRGVLQGAEDLGEVSYRVLELWSGSGSWVIRTDAGHSLAASERWPSVLLEDAPAALPAKPTHLEVGQRWSDWKTGKEYTVESRRMGGWSLRWSTGLIGDLTDAMVEQEIARDAYLGMAAAPVPPDCKAPAPALPRPGETWRHRQRADVRYRVLYLTWEGNAIMVRRVGEHAVYQENLDAFAAAFERDLHAVEGPNLGDITAQVYGERGLPVPPVMVSAAAVHTAAGAELERLAALFGLLRERGSIHHPPETDAKLRARLLKADPTYPQLTDDDIATYGYTWKTVLDPEPAAPPASLNPGYVYTPEEVAKALGPGPLADAAGARWPASAQSGDTVTVHLAPTAKEMVVVVGKVTGYRTASDFVGRGARRETPDATAGCRLGCTCPQHRPPREPWVPAVDDFDLLPDA